MAPETQNPAASPVRTLPPNIAPTATAQRTAPSSKPASAGQKARDFSTVPFWAGIGLSFLWVALVVLAVFKAGVGQTFAGLPLINWALGISAITSPIALIWMVTAYLQRAADVQSVAEPLRRQLMMITGESGAAEVRIRRFNQAIREQLDLLKSTQTLNRDDLVQILERVKLHKNELEQFESNSVHHVKEIQDVIRRSMQYIEKLMDDKFTMLRVLDGKLVQSGDNVARQTESVREQLGILLEDIEANTNSVSLAIEKALKDGKKLSDTARAQETSLISAAESASTTLYELSGKIDLNIARFLERANTARTEAEHLSSALDSQTRSLDEFSSNLPARVSEAEAILRGVADRLYASEQLAREQAVKLSDQLSNQVEGLQNVLDKFVGRLDFIDGTLKQRQTDLDGLVVRISGASNDLAHQIEDTIIDLGSRADISLKKYESISHEARRGAADMAEHLAETAAKYEAATKDLTELSSANSGQLRTMSADVAAQLSQFQALQKASQLASEEVQQRAAAALQNMQHVLERLLATRDATQSVGETLTSKMRQAIDENESVITRINEAAQMTVRSLGIATESLAKQESAITGNTDMSEARIASSVRALVQQAEEAEAKLRAQNNNLATILQDTEDKLSTTDRKLSEFASRAVVPVQSAFQQIESSTAQGAASLDHYCVNVQGKISLLQDINSRVNTMGDNVAQTTTETLSTLEQLNSRFLAARAAQEESTRTTLDQFNAVAERLQREVGSLNVSADGAVSTLQQAASKVSAQTQQIQRDSQESASKIQLVTAALQNEAAQIRTSLQKQSDDLANDLARAERQFTTLGDQVKQRTDAAYALLDRMADHYNQLTRAATDEFEARAGKLEQSATQASGKVEQLNSAIGSQLTLITNGTAQLETNAGQISATTGRALQQLTTFNEKLTVANEGSATISQQVVTRLEETGQAFARQSNAVSEAAQNAIAAVQRSGANFGEQATRMLDSSQQVDQNIRNLAASTSSYAEQASQIRAGIEQQSQRLSSQLQDNINQIDTTSGKLQQVTATATLGADQAAQRFNEVTHQATSSVGKATQELLSMAAATETKLSSLGANITQQTATLTLLGEQLGSQHTQLLAANETQRNQLVELFEKLGAAHAEASSVAERSIVRLNDAVQQIHRQLGALSDQSQVSLGNVRTAASGFADQSGILIQQAQQAEQQARTVLSVTAALQDQAKQLREALHSETERTTDLLGNLLGKLNASGSELRSLGITADEVINNVHNGALHQTTALNSTIQMISERQRSLTTALDAQRDVLNGLLTRMTIAQDEVASSAERNVTRLNDSSQQITRQLEDMEQQAQNTLANVRAVTAHYGDEARALNLQSQNTEQQARTLLTATADIHEKAKILREGVQQEGARVIEQLGQCVTKLEATADEVRRQGGNAVHAIDQSALAFDAIAKKGTEALDGSVKHLTDISSIAELRLKDAAEKVKLQSRVVEEAGEQAEAQARQLADTAEYATSRIVTLRSSMAEADRDGRDILEKAGLRIAEVKSTLQQELEHVAEISRQAVQQVAIAGEMLATQSDALRANIATSESAIKSAADELRQETVQLPAILGRSASQISDSVTSYKAQTSEMNAVMLGNADRFINVAGATRDTVNEEMTALHDVASKAEATLKEFNTALAAQIVAIRAGTGDLTAEQAAIVEQSSRHIASLTAAGERLARIRGEATDTAERLVRDLEAIDTTAASTTQRLSQVSGELVRNTSALADQADRAESHILGATQNFREQLERIRSGVQMQIDDINRGLMQITAQLERTGTTLRATTAGTVTDVEKIAVRFDQTSKESIHQLTERTARMRLATEEVAQLLSGFGDQIEGLLDRLSVAGTGIKQNEHDLVSQMQTALTHLSGITEKLDVSRRMAVTVSDETRTKLSEVAQQVETQMKTMVAGSETVTNIVRGVTNMYGEQTQGFTRGVVDAQSQVLVMNKSLEEMQQRTDRMRVALKMQADDLLGSLEQILKQLATTGDGLEDAVDAVLLHKAEKALKKIG
jgi:SMC interacting uncharacterized protein involved in chromosome segregation